MPRAAAAVDDRDEATFLRLFENFYNLLAQSINAPSTLNTRDQLTLDYCYSELARAGTAVSENRVLDAKICVLNALKLAKETTCAGDKHPVAQAIASRQLKMKDIDTFAHYTAPEDQGTPAPTEVPQLRQYLFRGGRARGQSVETSIQEFLAHSKLFDSRAV